MATKEILVKLKTEIIFDASSLREQPIVSGYKPSFDSFNNDFRISGMIFFNKTDKIKKGEKSTVEIRLPKTFCDLQKIMSGMKFSFFEANYLVGDGVVLDVL
jgi:translation elongation factor EF-Tu-like GTPase